LEAAETFISRFVLPEDFRAAVDYLFAVDYKSALQEYLQAVRLSAASYRVVEESGPEHHKTFVVEVSALDLVARGTGESKKVAEQDAARKLLEQAGTKQNLDA
jgi:ribonuclease III